MLIPVLENPNNRKGWPEMLNEDINHQLYSLRGTIYRMWGQLKGQTLLSLPFGLDTLQRAERIALDTYVIILGLLGHFNAIATANHNFNY